MAARVEVRELREAEFVAWAALVAASPDGSPYSLAEYLDILCAAAGGGFRILGAFRGDELVGGVGLYERDGAGGRYVAPRLLLYYLSPVLRPWETRYPSQRTARQVEVLGRLAEALTGSHAAITLKCRHTVADVRPFQERGWTARPSYSYVVPIADLESAHSRVEQNLRRLVDRCARQGLTVGEDDDGPSFVALHARTLGRRDVGPYLPERAFAGYLERIRKAGLGRVYTARLPDGRPVASQLVLAKGHPLTHTVAAATAPEFLNLGAAAFLRWKVFEALSAEGFAANDLTDAALNPVTHFKAQLGGDLVLCPVLESPATPRWRAARSAVGAFHSVAGAARQLLRRRPSD